MYWRRTRGAPLRCSCTCHCGCCSLVDVCTPKYVLDVDGGKSILLTWSRGSDDGFHVKAMSVGTESLTINGMGRCRTRSATAGIGRVSSGVVMAARRIADTSHAHLGPSALILVHDSPSHCFPLNLADPVRHVLMLLVEGHGGVWLGSRRVWGRRGQATTGAGGDRGLRLRPSIGTRCGLRTKRHLDSLLYHHWSRSVTGNYCRT